jgi:nucleotide-binding universal stress UspA family protein
MTPTIHVATELHLDGGLLVGHDGSESAAQAVRWAGRLAVRLQCELHVVRTWVISTAPRPSSATTGYVPPLDEFEAAVLDQLRADIAEVELPDGVEPHCHVLHGPTGRRLVEASESGAEMLVVGSRGAGGFRGLVFGSTAEQVVKYARCPVVVVPVDAVGEPADLDQGTHG